MGDSNVTTVEFNGHSLETFEQGGIEWVSVRSIATGIGLDSKAQQQKLLNQKDKFDCGVITSKGKDGRVCKMVCIPVKKIPGWLFTVNPNKIKEKARAPLELYQEKCFDILYDYWHEKNRQGERELSGTPTDRLCRGVEPKQQPLPALNPQPNLPMQHKLISINPNTGEVITHEYSGKILVIPHETARNAVNDHIAHGEKLQKHVNGMVTAFQDLMLGADMIPKPLPQS